MTIVRFGVHIRANSSSRKQLQDLAPAPARMAPGRRLDLCGRGQQTESRMPWPGGFRCGSAQEASLYALRQAVHEDHLPGLRGEGARRSLEQEKERRKDQGLASACGAAPFTCASFSVPSGPLALFLGMLDRQLLRLPGVEPAHDVHH